MLIIAHRGASAVAPESTRAAIQAAARAGAHMVELDVQMTSDGRLVAFHDDRLERTTNGMGRVAATRYQRLAQLDAGTWFAPRFAGQRILLVSQAIRLVPRRMRINLELKRTTRRRLLLRRLRGLLRRTRVARHLLLSSFDPRLLRPFASSRVACALICRRDPDRSLREAIRLRCWAWHPFYTLATPRRIARAHAAGLRVHVWTLDDPHRVRQLLRRNVDGVFTNHPHRVRQVLR